MARPDPSVLSDVQQDAHHQAGGSRRIWKYSGLDTVTVILNGKTVIPKITLPDLPADGPLGLQHHGGPKGPDGKYTGIPALVQFKNIYVKELQ
jgi:hypothetical protein